MARPSPSSRNRGRTVRQDLADAMAGSADMPPDGGGDADGPEANPRAAAAMAAAPQASAPGAEAEPSDLSAALDRAEFFLDTLKGSLPNVGTHVTRALDGLARQLAAIRSAVVRLDSPSPPEQVP